MGNLLTERIIYVQTKTTKKNGLRLAISMSRTPGAAPCAAKRYNA
jgi:hypothetical protein